MPSTKLASPCATTVPVDVDVSTSVVPSPSSLSTKVPKVSSANATALTVATPPASVPVEPSCELSANELTSLGTTPVLLDANAVSLVAPSLASPSACKVKWSINVSSNDATRISYSFFYSPRCAPLLSLRSSSGPI